MILAFGSLLLAGVTSMGMAGQILDKTLVVWASPANLDQRAGSALTLDDGQSHFDGVVFGELSPKKWMAGSDTFSRTQRDQSASPNEANQGKSFVQIAIVYHGREVAIYRNGKDYARYTIPNMPNPFGNRATVLFGRRHLDAHDPENSFVGRIKDARIYDRALSRDTIAAMKPGQMAEAEKPWAWWSFGDQGLREKTGRFTEIQLVGDVRLEDGCLVLGGKGASVISTAVGDGPATPLPKEWTFDSPVPEEAVRSARLLRERLLADPYRPGYHFCVPEDMGIPGDPNGAFYYKGRYHLMYLYSRAGSGFCWGHVSSADLVHWRHHPDAIGPGHGDEGCFSGGAFVDSDGTAYLSYWMLWGAKGIGIAKSTGPDFDHWTKLDVNPVIRSTEFGVTEIMGPDGKPEYLGSADPSNIWKHDGRYYMLTGNLLVLNKVGRSTDSPVDEQGDRVYLFESTDLAHWSYRHVFYRRNPAWTNKSEDDMCPSFLPLPSSPDGGPPSEKHLLLFISHNKGCQYYVGSYRNDHFYPDKHGRMTWVDNTYFAPEALIDGKGRQVMWAWLTDNPGGEKDRGWSGVYGLPRTLWLGDDGTLCMRPVKEIESLRGEMRTWDPGRMPPRLEGFAGDSFELDASIDCGSAAQIGFGVRSSRDGEEGTRLYYDAAAKELVFDSTHSGRDGRMVVERAPLELKPGETLNLRIFVDKSVVEVYANDRQAICRRVYPTKADSLGVEFFQTGRKGSVRSIKAWTMAPSNPY